MALRTPPSWLQNGSHPAENDRLTTQALYATSGVIGATSMAITAQASPNMTVNAAAGWCAVAGSTANSGVYVAYNDATTVLTITTANPSLPRIDRIVVLVEDAFYSGAANTVSFSVIAGTPAASPSAPATPSNAISLATIAVAAAASNITAANITDTRVGATSNAFLPLTGGTVTGTTTHSGATVFSGVVTASNTITSTSSITAASLIASAGTATVAPLKLTSGTNLTTPQAGAFEYDGSLGYFTPEATSAQRGLLGADYYYSRPTNYTLTNGTAAQSLYGVGITLPVGRYEVRMTAVLQTGTTSHNTAFSWGGTATLHGSTTLISISGQGTYVSPQITYLQNTSRNMFTAASADPFTHIFISGIVAVTGAGTLIPQIAFSAAPGGTNNVFAGSAISIRRIASTGSTTPIAIGNWA